MKQEAAVDAASCYLNYLIFVKQSDSNLNSIALVSFDLPSCPLEIFAKQSFSPSILIVRKDFSPRFVTKASEPYASGIGLLFITDFGISYTCKVLAACIHSAYS